MITVDALKISYRQTKDGFAITFVLHPQDDHDELARAPIGSQWQMQLVPLDENGNAGATPSPAVGERLEHSPREAGSRPSPASRLTKLACMCCKDPVFWRYLSEHGHPTQNEDDARRHIYLICHVSSRKEFIIGTPAADRWVSFYDQFAVWRDVPEEVA